MLVFVYSAAALAISIANRASSSNLELPFNIADLLVAILLFSCNSAASNTSVIASNGSDRLGWTKICDIVGSFCGQATAAIVLSMFAALAYVLLVVLGIINLHKRSLWWFPLVSCFCPFCWFMFSFLSVVIVVVFTSSIQVCNVSNFEVCFYRVTESKKKQIGVKLCIQFVLLFWIEE